MNIPLVGTQVRKLPKGYHITRTQIGIDEEGIPLFYPNRRQRRFKVTNRNKIVQFIKMTVLESKYQFNSNDTVLGRVPGTYAGNPADFLGIRSRARNVNRIVRAHQSSRRPVKLVHIHNTNFIPSVAMQAPWRVYLLVERLCKHY